MSGEGSIVDSAGKVRRSEDALPFTFDDFGPDTQPVRTATRGRLAGGQDTRRRVGAGSTAGAGLKIVWAGSGASGAMEAPGFGGVIWLALTGAAVFSTVRSQALSPRSSKPTIGSRASVIRRFV